MQDNVMNEVSTKPSYRLRKQRNKAARLKRREERKKMNKMKKKVLKASSRCYICGRNVRKGAVNNGAQATIDHVVAKSTFNARYKAERISNKRVCCLNYNQTKNTKPLKQFLNKKEHNLT